jgi:hypothetical protein
VVVVTAAHKYMLETDYPTITRYGDHTRALLRG